MKDVWTEYQLFQRNEFMQKLITQADKYWRTCPERDVMPTMDEFNQFAENDLNLLSKDEFDKMTKEKES